MVVCFSEALIEGGTGSVLKSPPVDVDAFLVFPSLKGNYPQLLEFHPSHPVPFSFPPRETCSHSLFFPRYWKKA